MARRKNSKWIMGGLVISAAIIAISFISVTGNSVYFLQPNEAIAQAAELNGKTISVGGLVKPGSTDWQAEQLSLKFTITDNQGNDIHVSHKGTPPDMFKEGQGVVVEGRLDESGQNMVSRQLMVKHSEEYKKPGDHSTMNKMYLEKSLFKN